MTRGLAAFRRGLRHEHARRFLRARRELAAAIRAGGAVKPWACQELVQTFLRRREAERAEPFLRTLLAPDDPLLLHALGYLYRRSGRTAEARRAFEEAWRLHPRPWAAALELGWMSCAEGREAEGLDLLRRAERHFARVRDVWGEAIAVTYRATCAFTRWRLREAERLFERAAVLKREAGDVLGLATATYHLGYVRYYTFDHLAAHASFEEALRLQRSIGFTVGVTASLTALASVEQELGEGDMAWTTLEQALRMARRERPLRPADQVVILENMAHVALRRGRPRQAESKLRRAMLLLGPGSDWETRSTVAGNLVEALEARGRHEDALAEASEIRRDATGAVHSPKLDHGLGRAEMRALVALGRPAEAVALGRRLQADGPSAAGAANAWSASMRTSAGLAAALLAAGEVDEAVTVSRAALRAVAGLVSEPFLPALRMAVTEACWELEDVLVTALLAKGRSAAAWRASRHAKGRSFVGVATSGPLGARPRGRRDRELDALQAQIRLLVHREGKLGRAEGKRLDVLRLQHADASRWRKEAAVGVELREGGSQDLARALEPNSVLVEFHVMEDATIAFAATRRETTTVRLDVGERWLASAVARLLAPLRSAASSRDPARHLAAFDDSLARVLHARLVAPVLAGLSGPVDRLFVVADGPLHALPFDMLPSSPTGEHRAARGDALRLGDTVDVGLLVSSNLVLSSPRLRRRRLVLSLGFSPTRPVSIQRPEGARLLRPLPRLDSEVAAVARAFPEAIVRRGGRASRDEYERWAPRADIIHVAAHGFSDARAAGLSGLVLAPAAGSRDAFDFLTAEQVSRVRLSGAVVILSACDTWSGQLRRREGMLGLARAFMQAGAGSVLSTLWPVDDAAACQVVAATCRGLAVGTDLVRALGDAKRQLRTEAPLGCAHPFFWAGFSACAGPGLPAG